MAGVESLISNAHARLDKVIIEELSWERLVRNYDSPASFFFFDPHYLGNTQKAYKGWTLVEMESLAIACRSLKGRWMMTAGDQPGIRNLFSDCLVTPVDRQSCMKKTGNKERYHELIIEPR
jgi:DNA adenine methylase